MRLPSSALFVRSRPYSEADLDSHVRLFGGSVDMKLTRDLESKFCHILALIPSVECRFLALNPRNVWNVLEEFKTVCQL